MSFLPNSTIYLCQVPFDSSNKNQVYFDDKDKQRLYFVEKSVDMLISYIKIRKTKPDGSLQSSIKVERCVDDLRKKGVNYLFYQNANHGEKLFFCFIDKLIYINEDTTEIVFHTDVYQTWLFDVHIMPSFVVREHTETDIIGEHIVPEKFNFNEYTYTELINKAEINDNTQLDDYCYLMCSSESWIGGAEGDSASEDVGGVPQGFRFGVCLNSNDIITLTNEMADKNEGWLQSIIAIPQFNLRKARIGKITGEGGTKEKDNEEIISGEILWDSDLNEEIINIIFDKSIITFEGYKPKNNKLFSAPYFSLSITNHNGNEKDYPLESFSGSSNTGIKDIYFKLTGDISPNPCVYLIPSNFMGVSYNYDYAITLSELPQISHNSDTYKLWLAKNQGTLALETVGNVANIVTGLASGMTTGGIGGLQAVSGVQGVINTINTVNQASRQPNKITGGGGKNTLLLAKGMNKFEYYWKCLKRDHAETVDNFFTMYGYQINKVKQPCINSRPYFNYIETIDINITGGIPWDDMAELKNIYNSGVTLWKPDAIMYNYDVDNSPQ